MKNISIDIETFSSVDLAKCGVYKYAESPDFQILLFGYSLDGGEVQVIDLASGESIPEDVLAALTDDDVTKWAFNANFERVCLSRHLDPKEDPRALKSLLSLRRKGRYCLRQMTGQDFAQRRRGRSLLRWTRGIYFRHFQGWLRYQWRTRHQFLYWVSPDHCLRHCGPKLVSGLMLLMYPGCLSYLFLQPFRMKQALL